MSRLSVLKEFWRFVRARKRYWLIPVIVILVGLGVLLVLAETTGLAPFIYTLF
jgi:hypothetical protein